MWELKLFEFIGLFHFHVFHWTRIGTPYISTNTCKNTCFAVPPRKRLQQHMQKHDIYCYVLLRDAKNKSQTCQNTCFVAPARRRFEQQNRTIVNAVFLRSGSRETLVIAASVRKHL